MSSTILFLSLSWAAIDQEMLDYLLDEKMRLEYPLIKQDGCPFEPGDFYNLECV